jgi:hypothetical protein
MDLHNYVATLHHNRELISKESKQTIALQPVKSYTCTRNYNDKG